MAERNNDMKNEDKNDNMGTTLTSKVEDEGFWREVWRQARLAWYLIRSPEVPLYLKLLPALAVVYVLLPTDFIPDVFPVIGQLDDVTALLVGAKVFIELAPQDVVARYLQSVRKSGTSAASGDSSPAHRDESAGPGTSNERDADDVESVIIIEGDYDVLRNGKEKDQAD